MRQSADAIDPTFSQQWTYKRNQAGTDNDGMVTYYTKRQWVRPKERQTLSPEEANTGMNRKLRDRDTFLSMFPNYRIHGESYET